MQDIKLADTLVSNLQIPSSYKTLDGAAADVDGAPVYTSDDPAVGSVLSQDDAAMDADKTHLVVIELHHVLGPCKITVVADANMDPDGPARDVTASYEFQVVADDAAVANFGSVGTLIPK